MLVFHEFVYDVQIAQHTHQHQAIVPYRIESALFLHQCKTVIFEKMGRKGCRQWRRPFHPNGQPPHWLCGNRKGSSLSDFVRSHRSRLPNGKEVSINKRPASEVANSPSLWGKFTGAGSFFQFLSRLYCRTAIWKCHWTQSSKAAGRYCSLQLTHLIC